MEGLEEIIEGHAPAIVAGLAVLEERLQALVLQVITHQAGLRQADNTTWGLHPRNRMQALAHPKCAVRTVADRIHELVGIAHAEAGHEDLSLVRFAVTIGVCQLDQSVKVADEDRGIADVIGERLDALDHREPFSKAHGFIGFTVPIGVFQAKNVIARLHARHGLRIGRRTADIQTPLGVPRHLGRFGDPEGLVGEEIDHEAVGDLEGGLLFGGGHHLLRADVRSGLRGRLGGLHATSQ